MQTWALFALQAVIIAAVTSWITVYLSKRQFRYQQGWERKLKCYEEILGRLNDMILLGLDLTAFEENPNHFPFFEDDEAVQKLRRFMQDIVKAYSVWSLLISKRATCCLEEMFLALNDTPRTLDINAIYFINKTVEKCLIDLHNAARSDLWGWGIGYYRNRWLISVRSGLIDTPSSKVD